MATRTTTTCDICGVEKKETNHWYQVNFLPPGDELPAMLGIRPWQATIAKVIDVCGEKCLLVCIQRDLYKLNAKRDENERSSSSGK